MTALDSKIHSVSAWFSAVCSGEEASGVGAAPELQLARSSVRCSLGSDSPDNECLMVSVCDWPLLAQY